MLYNEIMHPELLEDHPPPSGVGDTAHTATPTTRDKGKTASGGAGRKEKGGGGGKDKKGKIVKEETQKESIHEVTGKSWISMDLVTYIQSHYVHNCSCLSKLSFCVYVYV